MNPNPPALRINDYNDDDFNDDDHYGEYNLDLNTGGDNPFDFDNSTTPGNDSLFVADEAHQANQSGVTGIDLSANRDIVSTATSATMLPGISTNTGLFGSPAMPSEPHVHFSSKAGPSSSAFLGRRPRTTSSAQRLDISSNTGHTGSVKANTVTTTENQQPVTSKKPESFSFLSCILASKKQLARATRINSLAP